MPRRQSGAALWSHVHTCCWKRQRSLLSLSWLTPTPHPAKAVWTRNCICGVTAWRELWMKCSAARDCKSNLPNGVMYMWSLSLLLSWRTPPPSMADPPKAEPPPLPDDNVMDGWGLPLRWLSVLVSFWNWTITTKGKQWLTPQNCSLVLHRFYVRKTQQERNNQRLDIKDQQESVDERSLNVKTAKWSFKPAWRWSPQYSCPHCRLWRSDPHIRGNHPANAMHSGPHRFMDSWVMNNVSRNSG